MAKKLFQVNGGFSDGNVSYLSGTGTPGGDASFQDQAPVGSVYEDVAAGGMKYRKHTAGAGADKWEIALAAAGSITRTVTQIAHGFAVGDWIIKTITGYTKGLANSTNTSDIVGIVDKVVSADKFILVTSGFSSVPSTFNDGSGIFLSDTVAGASTSIKPTQGILKTLGLSVEGLVFVAINMTVDMTTEGAPLVPLSVTTNITTLTKADGVLVDQHGGIAWFVEVADDTNGQRFVCQVMGGHNGTTLADATQADCQTAYEMEFPENSDIPGLAIGVGLTGTGATQELELQVAATNAVQVSARRISV